MDSAPPFLPYARHRVDEDDIAAVVAALRSDFLTTGPIVPVFETSLAETVGSRHAIACSSGTAALHLLAMGLDIGPGDAVVVPAVTYAATANAFRLTGAEVVFADVDAETGLMTRATAERAIASVGGAARAIVPVHYAGECADMEGLAELASAAGAALLEDACHALGSAAADGSPVGACRRSRAAVFSLHPVKTIAAGEGGAVTTNDDRLAAKLRSHRENGVVRDPDLWVNRAQGRSAAGAINPWYHEFHVTGLNYRLSEIHGALAASQLRKLPRAMAERARLLALYEDALAPLAPLVRPLRRSPGIACRHLLVVLIDFPRIGIDRAELMGRLKAAGIGTQVHYIPLPFQPLFGSRPAGEFPGAARFYERCLSLPFFAGMADTDVDRVVEALAGILATARQNAV